MDFNLSNLSQTSDISVEPVKEISNISSQSYFLSALESSRLIMEKYRAATETLYESLANNSQVSKSFTQFFDTIDDVIDAFGSSIQKTSNDFCFELASKTARDKFILEEKDILCNYPKSKCFYMERYKFINLDANIPKNVAKFNYEKEYSKIENILSDRYTSNQEKITALMYEYNSFLDDIANGFYDYYRGEIIDMKGTAIRKGEFAEVLFYCFRMRNKIKEVTPDDIRESYQRLSMFKKYTNQIRIQKQMVEREYTAIKRNLSAIQFNRLVTTFGPDVDQLEAKFDTYIKVKTDQIVNMCNIHMMAYNAKLDAIASCYLQDRALLLSAMTRAMNTEENKSGQDLGGEI